MIKLIMHFDIFKRMVHCPPTQPNGNHFHLHKEPRLNIAITYSRFYLHQTMVNKYNVLERLKLLQIYCQNQVLWPAKNIQLQILVIDLKLCVKTLLHTFMLLPLYTKLKKTINDYKTNAHFQGGWVAYWLKDVLGTAADCQCRKTTSFTLVLSAVFISRNNKQ